MIDRQRELYSILAGPAGQVGQQYSAEIATNWTVITGAPGSGKSTICEGLAQAGHVIVPEASRLAINEARDRGFSADEIFADRALLAQAIMSRKLGLACALSPLTPCVWDTSLVDALVFCRRAKMDVAALTPRLTAYRYSRVVFLEPLAQAAVQGDPVRPQSAQERRDLHEELLAEYAAQGYRISRIAQDAEATRLQNVLAAIRA